MRSAKITPEAIEAAQHMIAHGWPNSQIRRVLDEKFGIGNYRTVARCVSRAKDANRELIDQPLKELLSQSAAYYFRVLQTDQSTREKLRARERLDRILGIEVPGAAVAGEQNASPVVRRLMTRPAAAPEVNNGQSEPAASDAASMDREPPPDEGSGGDDATGD